ncbi:glycosyltransferase family 2 protein [Paenibacillus sacheonensis]|uniref:Glycosyltransferase n=1 Tax=Paenibacillus sacheonensis TaxID=742054 RepID=A0A7X5C0M1_9BACL|nr:glycosyltransferase family 2 protein [Paenibacillus sacheonensis]MBM7566722.1 GT2 family glycosyltransferase [Paenibacillus sacheonensis]NBC71701.1 glycosyltransferase [Paenibacillus sacheonensis]
MNGMTSIIIPTYNGLSLLQAAVAAIRDYTDPKQTPYEIIVVDNGSSDGTPGWSVEQGLTCVSAARNAGFPKACNQGMRAANGEYLLLLNNDVTVSFGWLQGLLEALNSSADVGIVGPVTNYASGRQQVEYPFGSMTDFHRAAADAFVREAQGYEPIARLVGFCMLFRRALYERIGELDERFSPGHYEDDDYCFRARMHGFALLMCRNVFVHHEGSASFKRSNAAQVAQLVERNRELFKAKWQVDPANFM